MRLITCAKWGRREAGNYRKWCYRSMVMPEPHRHDYHELFWVEEGEGIHRINGLNQHLRVGDLVWIRAPDAHSYAVRRPGGLLEFVNVAFRAELWERVKSAHFPGTRTFDRMTRVEDRTHRLTQGQMQRLAAMVEDLRSGHVDELAVSAFLLAVWSLLRPRQSPVRNPVPDWLRFACTQAAEYPNFTGGTAALVRLAGRSPEHVARAFRRYYQERPIDLINRARMGYAAQQLRLTLNPVVDIALDCGMENLGHFYKVFRATHGLGPAAYRRRHLENILKA